MTRNIFDDFQLAQNYIGMTFDDQDHDCANFFLRIQKEIFGREYVLPSRFLLHEKDASRQILQITDARDSLARRLRTPEHGCAVLLVSFAGRRERWHIGTVFEWQDQFWVLHTSRVMSGASFNNLRDFAWRGQKIEGFYQCIL